MTKKQPSSPAEQDPPIQPRRNPVATIVYDTVLNTAGKDRMVVATSLIKRLDTMYNAMVRKAIALTVLKEQRRMIDALAHDGELVEELAESVTIKYTRETWDSLTRILDQFQEQEALSALETEARAKESL